MEKVHETIECTLRRYQMLPAQGRIVLGLSGGMDSMTLAHYFVSCESLRPRLLCVHVNHGIRGEEAARDERFVRDWCEKQGIPCQVLHADVPKEAVMSGESEETCGRRIRYAFFESLAPDPDDRIVVAHNANDQTETILFHLAGGTALRGLCGMPFVRGKIIRPLLAVTREDIEAHAKACAIPFVTDSTNEDVHYARNRLRHRVIPELLVLNPSLHESLHRTVRTLSEDEAFLQQLAVQGLREAQADFPGMLRADVLLKLPGPVRLRVLRCWMEEQGLHRVEEKHLRTAEALLSREGSFSPEGDWLFLVSHGVVSLSRPVEPFCTAVSCPGETQLPDGRLVIEASFSESAHKIHKLLFKNILDYDTIKSGLTLRHRMPGDVFQPPGRPAKSLKKLFNEAGLSKAIRSRLWLLEHEGNIVWLERFGVAAPYAAGPLSRRLLRVSLERIPISHSQTDRRTCVPSVPVPEGETGNKGVIQ